MHAGCGIDTTCHGGGPAGRAGAVALLSLLMLGSQSPGIEEG